MGGRDTHPAALFSQVCVQASISGNHGDPPAASCYRQTLSPALVLSILWPEHPLPSHFHQHSDSTSVSPPAWSMVRAASHRQSPPRAFILGSPCSPTPPSSSSSYVACFGPTLQVPLLEGFPDCPTPAPSTIDPSLEPWQERSICYKA